MRGVAVLHTRVARLPSEAGSKAKDQKEEGEWEELVSFGHTVVALILQGINLGSRVSDALVHNARAFHHTTNMRIVLATNSETNWLPVFRKVWGYVQNIAAVAVVLGGTVRMPCPSNAFIALM